MAIVVKTPPTTRVVDVADIRARLRLPSDEPTDGEITEMIDAATAMVETYTRRKLITQTLTRRADSFCDAFALSMGSVQQVSEVRFVDAAGADQILAADQYRLIRSTEPAYVVAATDIVLPDVLDEPDTVQIDIVVGYGGANAVPSDLRQAVRLLVGHINANRVAAVPDQAVEEIPFGVRDICKPHRVWF